MNNNSNIINAIINLVKKSNIKLDNSYNGNNSVNNMGEALENYIKNLFSDGKEDVFSWGGNQNNPPDAILKGGDAIEIKKLNLKEI